MVAGSGVDVCVSVVGDETGTEACDCVEIFGETDADGCDEAGRVGLGVEVKGEMGERPLICNVRLLALNESSYLNISAECCAA